MKVKLNSVLIVMITVFLIVTVVILPLCVKKQYVHINLITRSVFEDISVEDVSITLQNNLTNQYETLSSSDKLSLSQALENYRFWFVLPSIKMIFPRAGWDHRIMVTENGITEGYIITDTYIDIDDFLFYGNTRQLMKYFNSP